MKTFVIRNKTITQMACNFLQTLDPSRHWEIVIREYKAKRNNEQNRLYWALLGEIADCTPWSAEAWAEFFKQTFIGYEEIALPNGETQKKGFSTTTLNTAEFANHITRIQVYATGELGIRLAA